MERLGIIHGSFDFAVDLSGKWIFFEVNEAGQFLWMETYASSIPMLDCFVQFLMNPSADFEYNFEDSAIWMRDIGRSEEFQKYVAEDKISGLSYNLAEAIP